ncbi:hypothetical protein F4212_09150 [Candidatus Poribacteria bacterium]|nr:hypothetical protein [Candidatus Poribacteria bacterium]
MNTYRGSVYILIYLILICINFSTYAATINVPADQPTIQAGIDAAQNGDTVLVANGVYKGDGNVNINFKGKQITVQSQNGPEETMINCSWIPYTRGFIFQSEETHSSVLDGFTIRNGVHEYGGGIYCNNASPTIKNSIISWNKAVRNEGGTGRGGGIYCFNSDALIIDSTISNNIAEYTYGGGVYFDGNDEVFRETRYQPQLISCIISENNGSGVFIQDFASCEIRDTKILHNSLRGVVCTFFSRGDTQITGCEIAQNTGGGVEVSEYSIIKIHDSIIKQNTAKYGGGIYCSPSGNMYVSDCIIAQNIATKWGGGIEIAESKWGDAEITRCTITRNTASVSGGGLYVYCLTSFTLTNSIVWGNNSDDRNPEVYVSGRGIVFRANVIRDGLDRIGQEPDGDLFIYEDNIDKDPLFVNPDRGDYRLRQDSPALGMGPQTNVGGVLSVAPLGKRLVMWADIKRR